MANTTTNFFGNAEELLEESALQDGKKIDTEIDPEAAEVVQDRQIQFKNKVTFGHDTICKAKMDLVRLLDKICKEKKITYFAMTNVLISCVHYQKFIPEQGSKEWEFGFLRDDYEKLLKEMRKYRFPANIRFVEYYDDGKKKVLRETVQLEIAYEVSADDLVATDVFRIRFLPFDKLPKNTDTRASLIEDIEKEMEMYATIRTWNSWRSAKKGLRDYAWKHFYYGKRDLKKQHKKIHDLAASYKNDKESDVYGRIAFGRTKVITEGQLFPLQELPLEDVMIPCPNDVTVWTPVFNEELDYQVKSIQKADLVLLKRFDEVCRELGIGYFVCGGTMLGYMRHGGFIPWDDDVDVAMLRADYDRFLKEAGPYFDDRFFIQTRESDPKIPYLFSKIRLNNTEYITAYNEHRDFHKGLCLDIFPFDYLPNDEKEREAFIEKVKELAAQHGATVNGQSPEPQEGPGPRNDKEKEYISRQQKKRADFNKISLKDTQAAYINEATKYNATAKEKGLTTVASFVPSYTYIDLEDLLPYQDGDFNGIKIMVPKRPDIFLTMQYGDYMKLPPKHMQIAHKLVRWSADVAEPHA